MRLNTLVENIGLKCFFDDSHTSHPKEKWKQNNYYIFIFIITLINS